MGALRSRLHLGGDLCDVAGMAYCPECWTEFVAGVPSCSDCGGPLSAGELPDRRPPAAAAPAANAELTAIDTLIGEFPGERAELLAEALRMEGLHSRLECDGVVKHRGPTVERGGPISVSLPVAVFVAAAEVERAREIIHSLSGDDLIGEEWAAAEGAEPIEPDSAAADDGEAPALEAEGTKPPILLLIIAGALVLLYFLRS